MQAFLCKDYVSEEKNEHYLGYTLKDNSYFYNTLYQIVKKSNDTFVECYKLIQNGRIKFIYDINEYRPYNAVSFNLSLDQFVRLLGSFVASLKKIEENGFVQIETLDIDLEKIYVNTEEFTARLVCVPLNVNSVWDTKEEFHSMAVTSVGKMIYNSEFMGNEFFFNMFDDCNSSRVSFEELYNRMRDGHYGIYFIANDMVQENGEQQNFLRLHSLFNGYDIEINKSKFTIGKNSGDIDLSGYSMLSRTHCEIINSDGNYYIIDKNSTNGTYVNNSRIPSEKMIPIKSGDNILLADLEYVVV
ncbi:MAG: FHA domain-containing protein [Clostridium sp.]|nr:FHA domain-containing protein [Clostridium sp.]